MKVIKPIEIDINTLTITSNLDADAYYDKYGTYYATVSGWNSGTSYNLGDLVNYKGRVYQSVFATANTNNNPETGRTNLATGVDYWVDNGSLNKFAAFDTTSNTQSINQFGSTITFSFIAPKSFSAIAFTNCDIESIEVDVLDSSGSVIYTKTKTPATRTFANWYEWVFNPFSDSLNVLFEDLTPLVGATISITATNTASAPKIGGIVAGSLIDIGSLQYGVRLPLQDYSVTARDEFGNTTLVKRNLYSGIDGTLICKAQQANSLLSLRRALSATPTVWIGSDDADSNYYNSLFILGIVSQFEPMYDSPTEFSVRLVVNEI